MNIKKLVMLVFVIIMASFIATSIIAAEDGNKKVSLSKWTPFQLAIWNPVQLFNEHRDVYGLRTNRVVAN